MAHLLTLTQHSCNRGDLTVFEGILPGTLAQIFYVTNAADSSRGGHRHKKAWQALVCLQGSVDVWVESGTHYRLDRPDRCLVLEPDDSHLLTNFQQTAIVLVVSTEAYDTSAYIDMLYTRATRHKPQTGQGCIC